MFIPPDNPHKTDSAIYAYGVAAFNRGMDSGGLGGLALHGWNAARLAFLTENSVNAEKSVNAESQHTLKVSCFHHGIDERPGIESALGHSIGYKAQQWGVDIIPVA